eukprot:12626467-Alexandrium_andersonii.AAC.1
MTDHAIFDVEITDIGQFRAEVADWCRYWGPDEPACRVLSQCPAEVIAVVLSRPSGWAGCTSISRTLTTAVKRRLNVYRGHYDRNAEQEQWVNERPFDRSGNIFFKNQSSVVR